MRRFRFLVAMVLLSGVAMFVMPSCSKDDDSPQSQDNNQQPDNNQKPDNNQQPIDQVDPSFLDAEGFVSTDKLSEMISKLNAGNYEIKVKGELTQDIVNAAGEALRKRRDELKPETPSSKSLDKSEAEHKLVLSVSLDLTKTTGLAKIEGSMSGDIASRTFTGFAGCQALVSIAFPESLTEIGAFAFIYCSNLAKAMLPKTIAAIGEDAFANCPVTLSINGVDNPVLNEEDALSSLADLYFRTHQNFVFIGDITDDRIGNVLGQQIASVLFLYIKVSISIQRCQGHIRMNGDHTQSVLAIFIKNTRGKRRQSRLSRPISTSVRVMFTCCDRRNIYECAFIFL